MEKTLCALLAHMLADESKPAADRIALASRILSVPLSSWHAIAAAPAPTLSSSSSPRVANQRVN